MFFALMALGLLVPLVLMTLSDEDEDEDADVSEPEGAQDAGSDPSSGDLLDDDGDLESQQVQDITTGEDTENTFNIDLEIEGNWSDEQEDAIITAAEYLSDIILADMPDGVNPDTGERIDDLLIRVTPDSFTDSVPTADDGVVYQTLGAAKVVELRPGTALPLVSEVYVNNELDIETFRATVLHEMLHALGFGFDAFTNQVGLGIDGLRFTGANAIAAYNDDFPVQAAQDPTSQLGVPVTQEGGHWREDVFGAELMTPFQLGNHSEYLSQMTIAALEDIGYDTIWDDVTSNSDQSGPRPRVPIAIGVS